MTLQIQIMLMTIKVPLRSNFSYSIFLHFRVEYDSLTHLPKFQPRANPGHLTIFCARGVGNLTGKAFPRVGNLTFAWVGWGKLRFNVFLDIKTQVWHSVAVKISRYRNVIPKSQKLVEMYKI